MPAPKPVKDLVARFAEHIDAYKRGNYNETQLRREFLDPFFAALGWDVFNERGYAGDYKDVVHEAQVKIAGTTKAPDYSFRIGGQRRFFVEAKKPSVDVKGDPHPAYQLRRYAWTAQLPLSILTDFEEFAVYDCRIKPSPKDKAATARVLYMKYDEYDTRWDEIESVFSREAIPKGGFDKYASSKTKKRGTAEPDDEFLQLLESWRTSIAQNIARNNDLSARQLNHAVQLIIDRIVFLRICEDRGVEEARTLQGIAKGKSIYAGLLKRFRLADAKYNSGLFHFENEPGREAPDTLTPSLTVGDAVLKDIIANLYYPESPYEFSVFRAEMLGHIYERFLGSVISLSATGKTAKVEEKPEVRKAGGVYYTPTYIVDYIVEHTVGELLKDRTLKIAEVGQGRGKKKAKVPRMDKPLRVLDPACGSGSFLLGAYDHLLDWHLRFYTSNDPEAWAALPSPPIAHHAIPDEKATRGDYRLTTSEKKRILTEHVYGVDIDAQAVEVTKLSLLLKVLEGENQETLEPLLFAKERALPDLSDNIKCGNSLIGSDFYTGQQGGMFDEEEQYRINAFDWNVEFEEIMAGGGFDAVIGNPPYVLLQADLRDDEQLEYLRKHYDVASYKVDTYHLFMELGVALAAPLGRCAMITPANFITNNYLSGLRRHLLSNTTVDHIVVIEDGVFHGISVDNAVFVLTMAGCADHVEMRYARSTGAGLALEKTERVNVDHALTTDEVLLTGNDGSAMAAVCAKADAVADSLGSIARVNFGKQLRNRKHHPDDVVSDHSLDAIKNGYRPCYTGRDVHRYFLEWNGLACLDNEHARKGGCWDPGVQNAANKLVTRQIGQYPTYAIDIHGHQCLNTMFMVTIHEELAIDPRYLLGILNSRLLRAFWLERFNDRRRTFPKIKGTYLKKLPVRFLDLSDEALRNSHDRMVDLVQSMLDMNERLHGNEAAKLTPQERRVLEGRIAATDGEIDQLVYGLYGLAGEEIAIVEEATQDHN